MEVFKLSKTFKFYSGHRLSKGYRGLESRLHGHSWTGEVSISCPELNSFDMGFGMSELGEILELIEIHFDHRTILYLGDPLYKFLQNENSDQVIGLDDNPTSETIAKFIYDHIEPKIPDSLSIDYVLINETEDISCKYSLSDNPEDDRDYVRDPY